MNITVINQILILTIMMVIGIILRKLKIITDGVNKGLSDVLINVSLPCLIISSFNIDFSMDMFQKAIIILICSIGIHIILIIMSNLLYIKFDEKKKCVFKFATIFSNCGFVGYPIVQGIFGDIGVFYTSIFTIPFNIFMFAYGVILFTGKSDIKTIKKSLINPPLIAIMIGLIIFALSINLPVPIAQTLNSIGGMTTPLSMFIIGGMLADVKLKDALKGFDIYYLNIVKLIVAPLLIFFVLKAFNLDEMIIQICVIMVAMPTASLIGVFAQKYDGDKVAASKCAFLTTVLSVFTIPAIMSFI